MEININLDGSETAEQLFNLGSALRTMSGIARDSAGASQPQASGYAPEIVAETNAVVSAIVAHESTVAARAETPAPAAAETEAQATTRKRRTKAEIEAAKAAETPAPEPTPEPTPEPQPEPEAPAAEQTPAANDPAPVASGRVWTNDEVQAIAVNVARRHTPSAVTSMLTEYGAARINMLSQENLNLLAERLTAKLAEAAEKAA